jgi:hypothetical protein
MNMFQQSEAAVNRDRSRDLLIISHSEVFKHEVHLVIINIISMLTVLH